MKKLVAFLWFLFVAPSIALAATHTIDTFGGTAGTNLEAHTPDSGGPWTNVDGDAGHLQLSGSNTLNTVSTTNGDGAWTVPVGTTDMYVQATIGTYGQWPTNGIGLAVRISDKNNFYGLVKTSGTQVGLYKRVAGTFTLIIPNIGITVTSGATVGLQIVGNLLTVYSNGSLVNSITDSSISGGTNAGFYTHNTTAGTGIFSRFESDTAGSGTPKVSFGPLMGVDH